jgi:protein phosphatase
MSYRWWSCGRTDTGRLRRVNEDAYLNLDNIQSADAFADLVRDRLYLANERMRSELPGLQPGEIMGSTVVAFLVYKREWRCLWAGDSRAYLMRDGRLTQITRDHNVAQEMVDRGEIRQEEAAYHPAANRITRAIGTQNELFLDEYRSDLRDGDTVLLCSDGLNKEVDDEEVEEILAQYDCDDASRELVDLTLERGARDNVTVAVIKFEETTAFKSRIPEDTAVNYDLSAKSTRLTGNVYLDMRG